MKKTLLLLLLGFGIGCNPKSEPQSTNASAPVKAETTPAKAETTPAPTSAPSNAKMDSVETPKGFKKMETARGDLDKDGIDELVVVFDTPTTGEMGTERQVQIFKKDQTKWKLWQTSTTAVMPSENGGVMGDPFESIAIQNGVIVISHFGGSRSKWHYTHRYRLAGTKFELIGATNTSGEPCVGFETYDYNLSTGKVETEIGEESCDEQSGEPKKGKSTKSAFVAKVAKPIMMDGFRPGENEVKIPNKPDASFYY